MEVPKSRDSNLLCRHCQALFNDEKTFREFITGVWADISYRRRSTSMWDTALQGCRLCQELTKCHYRMAVPTGRVIESERSSLERLKHWALKSRDAEFMFRFTRLTSLDKEHLIRIEHNQPTDSWTNRDFGFFEFSTTAGKQSNRCVQPNVCEC